jgi:hypothetical protein
MVKKSTKRKSVESYESAMKLYSMGSSIKEISEKLEINRSTISNWVRGATGKSFTEKVKFTSRLIDTYDSIEFMQNLNPLISDELRFNVYSYLLGLYLGDGCIYKYPRTKRFNITLDAKYYELNAYVSKTFELLFGKIPKNIYRKHSKCVDIYYSNCNLGLLFPQDGKGRKHDRMIALSEWQRKIVNFKFLLIGLFHSDGCFYKRPKYNKNYYSFVNKSKDIIDLFSECLNLHHIHHGIVEQKNGVFTINVYRDADKLKELIGTKEIIVSCLQNELASGN